MKINTTESSYGIYQNIALSSLILFEYIKTYQSETKKPVDFERLLIVLPFCYTEALSNDIGSRSNSIKGLINLIDDNKVIFQSLPLQVSELFSDLLRAINVGTNLSIVEFSNENLTIKTLSVKRKFSSSNQEMFSLIKSARKLAKWTSKLTDVEYVSFFNLK